MRRTNTAQWMEKYNRWQIKVQKDGVRRTFYSSTPGRKGQREANAKADAWLDDGIQGGNLRVEAVYPQFVASILSSNERERAKDMGRLYLLPAIGHKRIESLREDDFPTILDRAAAGGVSGKPLSRKTLSNLASVMRGFVRFCRRKRWTAETLEFLSIPKSAPKGEKRILQPKDLVQLFTSDTTLLRGKPVPDSYIHAYRFQVLTGLRPGELMGLRREDIHGREIHLQRSVNEAGQVTRGKNDNARRVIALTSQAQQELSAQLEASGEREQVFPVESQSTYRHRWKRYCDANGIPYISPYEMRHTFVSMVKALPEGEVKALVGHSRSMDTFGVYGHGVEGERERVADKLEAIFQELLAQEESGKEDSQE